MAFAKTILVSLVVYQMVINVVWIIEHYIINSESITNVSFWNVQITSIIINGKTMTIIALVKDVKSDGNDVRHFFIDTACGMYRARTDENWLKNSC